MAFDLMSIVSQVLTPQMIGQIGAVAGVDSGAAQKLVSGAIPSVLASLTSAAAAPGGAQKISDLVSNADPDVLTKLGAALSSGQGPMLGAGANALSGVIGASGLASLTSALGQFSGTNPAAAQTAIGAVSHAVVGALGQQDPSAWSDAGGVSALFASQKSAIMGALPGGLGNLLSSSGVMAGLGGLGAAAAGMGSAASSAAGSASSSAGGAMNQARAASSSTGIPTWAYIVIAVIVVALAYWFLTKGEPAKPAAQATSFIELALGDNRLEPAV